MDGEDKKTYDFTSVLNAAQNAFKTLHKRGSYNPKDLTRIKAYKNLVDETSHVINTAISHEVPQKMREYLEKDIHIFSGLKTHAQLTEARSYLMDNGKVRSFESFEHKVTKLNQAYNRDYLEAEYQFAVSSSQSAANWDNLQENTDRYWLEYRTAADDRVRTEHRTLHGICLPKNDPFWQEFYPPNGWRCRCVAVEVLAEDYTKSDSKKSIQKGNAATTQIGKSGKNTLEMFRFNPGTKSCVFPPNHTYTKITGAMDVKNIIKKELEKSNKEITNPFIKKEIKSTKDISDVFDEFSKVYPEYFSRGFKYIKSTTKRNVNGYTYMNGDIYMKTDRLNHIKDALNNIRNNKPTTFDQEDALSTLHHEIWHNANKPGNMRISKDSVKTMELANEFVSRKTLPDFMKKLGGELQNIDLINDRKSTGYNTMVRNYDKIVEWTKVDKLKHLESVQNHLIEGKYDNQMTGLKKFIADNTEFNLKHQTIEKLIMYSKSMTEEQFSTLLKNNENLLVKKVD